MIGSYFYMIYYRIPISYFEVDPITQHNIQLVQYTKQMQELLQEMQQSYKVYYYLVYIKCSVLYSYYKLDYFLFKRK